MAKKREQVAELPTVADEVTPELVASMESHRDNPANGDGAQPDAPGETTAERMAAVRARRQRAGKTASPNRPTYLIVGQTKGTLALDIVGVCKSRRGAEKQLALVRPALVRGYQGAIILRGKWVHSETF